MMPSKKAFLLFVFLSPFIGFSICQAQSKSDEERVIGEALEAIDNCYHWAGESGEGDEQRDRQIAEGVQRDCSLAQQKAESAYRKYPKNADLAARILQLMDIHYFDASDEEKKRVCDTAFSYFNADYLKSKDEDVFFRGLCPAQAKTLYGK